MTLMYGPGMFFTYVRDRSHFLRNKARPTVVVLLLIKKVRREFTCASYRQVLYRLVSRGEVIIYEPVLRPRGGGGVGGAKEDL